MIKINLIEVLTIVSVIIVYLLNFRNEAGEVECTLRAKKKSETE